MGGSCNCLVPGRKTQTVSGDTHAASLTGAVSNKTPEEAVDQGSSDIASTKFTSAASPGAGERAFANNFNKSVTTTAATKAVVITAYWHTKTDITNTKTLTIRKGTAASAIDMTGTTSLGSETSASATEATMMLTVVDTSPGTSNQVYNVTGSHGAAPSQQYLVFVSYTAIDDSHAASLTGSSGTCV